MESLVKYFADLPTKILDRVMRVVSRFTVGLIDTQGLNRDLTSFSVEVRKTVRRWRSWALSSFYWGNLWRAVITNDAERWQVDPLDVELVHSYLRQADKKQIVTMYYLRPVSRLDNNVILDLQQRLRKWAWLLYHKHLRFISRYDTGVTAEDLVGSVMEAGLRAMRRYEHQDNPKKTLNFSKRAAKNEAINLIGKHTRDKRARIVATPNDPERKYLCRTVSLEEVEPQIRQRTTAANPLFSAIRVQLGAEYERYARAILGLWPDFDEWVSEHYKQPAEKLPRRKLERAAREWSGITMEQAQQNLAPLLAEQLQQKSGYLALSQPM